MRQLHDYEIDLDDEAARGRPHDLVLDGYRVWFTRRRREGKTWTWVRAAVPGERPMRLVLLSRDPWPMLRPANAEILRFIRYGSAWAAEAYKYLGQRRVSG